MPLRYTTPITENKVGNEEEQEDDEGSCGPQIQIAPTGQSAFRRGVATTNRRTDSRKQTRVREEPESFERTLPLPQKATKFVIEANTIASGAKNRGEVGKGPMAPGNTVCIYRGGRATSGKLVVTLLKLALGSFLP